ncbi:ABC transporter ATP-binding protein [Plantactinospora sp. B6F1]|uniref:ATP-binding cassette domain-containing protein n=1 Tax=Plantactinospora sp. B6F1 TaxID=3158971 RepID=UPI0010F01B59
MSRAGAGLRLALATAARTDRRRLLLGAGLIVGSGVVGGSFPLWSKYVIEAVLDGGAGPAALAAVALAASWVLAMGMSNVGALALYDVRDAMDITAQRALIRATARVQRLDGVESPAYQDTLALVRAEPDCLSRCVDAAAWSACLLLQTTVAAGLLATVHPVLLGLPVLAVVAFLVGAWYQRGAERVEVATSGDERLAAAQFTLALDPAAGAELRVFQLPGELLRRHAALWRSVVGRRVAAETGAALGRSLGLLAVSLGFLAALAFVALLVPRGRATLGDLLLVYAAGQQAYMLTGSSVLATTRLYRLAVAAGRHHWLAEYPERAAVEASPEVSHRSAPAAVLDGIELQSVTFRYPGAERPALSGVTARIPAGSVVALVGHNGAGKSTLVKLLCKLYEPSSGGIAVDGTDLREIPTDAWRDRLTGGFQDFARFELRARESVGVGDLAVLDDLARVRAALDRCGYGGLERELPAGLDTPLGAVFPDGVGLSGGQWQRVALGRSAMRRDPLLLLLDEPTASLDAQAEDDIFRTYAKLAATGAADGRITMLVTHRFSTVRVADLILVLDSGRLVESGSHDELMSRAGVYARMYRAQADGYR